LAKKAELGLMRSSPVEHLSNGDDTSKSGMGDSALQSRTLESLASVKNYHAWLTDLALPDLGDHPLELGSGLGDTRRSGWTRGCPNSP
jgi:hypothetical protein